MLFDSMRKWLWKGLFTLIIWMPILFVTLLIIPVNGENYEYILLPLAMLGYFISLMSGSVYYKFHPNVHDKERRIMEREAKEADKWNNSHKLFIKIAMWFIWFFILVIIASLVGYHFNDSLAVFSIILSLWLVSLIVYLLYKKRTK